MACETMKRTPCEYIVWHGLPVLRKEIARSMITDFGLNEKETALKLGLTPAAVSQYLSGKRGDTDITNAKALQEINISAERIIIQRDDVVVSELCRLCKLFRLNNLFLIEDGKKGILNEAKTWKC